MAGTSVNVLRETRTVIRILFRDALAGDSSIMRETSNGGKVCSRERGSEFTTRRK